MQQELQSSEPPAKKIRQESQDRSSNHKRKRTAASIDVNKSALPVRMDTPWKVGAHVSAAGGIENSIFHAAEIGANAFALFLKSQRKWTSPALTPTSISTFKERLIEYGYSSSVILPHGNYLINLGNPDPEKREKSYACFLDDLKRCEELGLTLLNFHPGSTVGETTTENSISLVAQSINRAHKETNFVVTVIETMPGAGNQIGSDFAHLSAIITQVEDKSRVGVCMDTCHMFSAGYDIRKKEDWDATIQKFDQEVGLSYLKGMHLNDSKAEYKSTKDLHENVGLGNIGIAGFYHIMNDPRVQHIPLVLETPSHEVPKETWTKEITILNSLSGLELGDAGQALDTSIRGALERSGLDLGSAKVAEKRPAKAKLTKAKSTVKVTKKPATDTEVPEDWRLSCFEEAAANDFQSYSQPSQP
ncbi:hypothetical protein C0991_006128 [Blastosporella zonata]|nr:hypothetical protein C0991_006128 [Blastosporella zonata]